ncbi:MAG: DUF393 domain-containing protein, partial [Chlamydiae bacterium]|nr:DUF393 domain-containing protein [Chlamydiota bacterium]
KFLFQKRFYECNLRTYVRVGNKTGVYFFSLDADSILEVLGAKAIFHLNYRYRKIQFSLQKGYYDFAMENPLNPHKKTHIRLKISKKIEETSPLIQFISDRYSYFVRNKNHIFEGIVEHKEWRFHEADVLKIETNLLDGFQVESLPVAVYAKKTTVLSQFLIPAQKPIIFFDHECGLCHRALKVLLALDLKKRLLFAPINGKTYRKIYKHPPKNDRLILFDDQDTFDGAEALLHLLDHLPWFTRIFILFKLVPLSVLNRWYDAIAKVRRGCCLKKKHIDDPRILS